LKFAGLLTPRHASISLTITRYRTPHGLSAFGLLTPKADMRGGNLL
jgi:hypothetical protein